MALGKRKLLQEFTFQTVDDMAKVPTVHFYDTLNRVLDEAGFDEFVADTCRGYYDARLGRPALPISVNLSETVRESWGHGRTRRESSPPRRLGTARKLGVAAFVPARNWQGLAVQHGAMKGLRNNKSAEHLLRVLLLHFGCGHSPQETAERARQAGLAELSAVALWKCLKKSKDWLHALCGELFRERGVELAASGGPPMRAINATTIEEPGQTSSLWRLH